MSFILTKEQVRSLAKIVEDEIELESVDDFDSMRSAIKFNHYDGKQYRIWPDGTAQVRTWSEVEIDK